MIDHIKENFSDLNLQPEQRLLPDLLLFTIISIQCRIHGTFEAGILVSTPKKSGSTLPNSFFFYRINKLIFFLLTSLRAGYLRDLLLNQIWYGWRKTRRFHKKSCNSYLKTLMRHSYFNSDMRRVTIQNNLDSVYTWFKTIDFKSK